MRGLVLLTILLTTPVWASDEAFKCREEQRILCVRAAQAFSDAYKDMDWKERVFGKNPVEMAIPKYKRDEWKPNWPLGCPDSRWPGQYQTSCKDAK